MCVGLRVCEFICVCICVGRVNRTCSYYHRRVQGMYVCGCVSLYVCVFVWVEWTERVFVTTDECEVCMCVCAYVYVCTCLCVYLCLYMCVCA